MASSDKGGKSQKGFQGLKISHIKQTRESWDHKKEAQMKACISAEFSDGDSVVSCRAFSTIARPALYELWVKLITAIPRPSSIFFNEPIYCRSIIS